MNNSIEEALDIDGENPPVARIQISPSVRKRNTPEPKSQDFVDDYNYSRETLCTVIATGIEALNGAMNVATESQHPRAYEVASTLLGQLSSASKDLLALSEVANKIKQREEPTDDSDDPNSDNYFVWSTKELNDLIENKDE